MTSGINPDDFFDQNKHSVGKYLLSGALLDGMDL